MISGSAAATHPLDLPARSRCGQLGKLHPAGKPFLHSQRQGGEREIFLLPLEAQPERIPGDVHLQPIPGPDLLRRDQIRQGLYQVPFNGALKVPRAVLRVRTLLEQESFGGVRQCKGESPSWA